MTDYSIVFESFLSKISDPLYSVLEVELLEKDLISIMNRAILDFPYSKVDIRDKNDTVKQFNVDLGVDEIELLSEIMTYTWLMRELKNVDNLRQYMTTKDFNTYSQANHINALKNTLQFMKIEIKRLKIQYGLRDTHNTSSLSKLGGD